jgi:hypothetical protein
MYLIKPEEAAVEKQWLNSMQVYPAMQQYFDWIQNKMYERVGVIVSDDTALAIKLRHPLQFQVDYRQR